MNGVVRLLVLTALRDRVFAGLAALVVAGIAVSLFLGDAAIGEPSQTGLVYAAGATRLIVVAGLCVFVALQTQQLYDTREIEAILSRSISRTKFVLSYWLGFSCTLVLLVLPGAAAIVALSSFSAESLVWALSLLLECMVVSAFAIFAGLTFERAAPTIFATLAFYAFARLIGFLLGIRDATPDSGANLVINPMFEALAVVLPRIDLMTQTDWLLYGLGASLAIVPTVLLQAAVFIGVALTAAAFDLARRQF